MPRGDRGGRPWLGRGLSRAAPCVSPKLCGLGFVPGDALPSRDAAERTEGHLQSPGQRASTLADHLPSPRDASMAEGVKVRRWRVSGQEWPQGHLSPWETGHLPL